MLARRLLIFVALVMGLTALAASLAPRDARFEPQTRTPVATPAAAEPARTAESEAEAGRPTRGVRDVPGEPLLREIDADGPRRTLLVVAGERVRLAVSSRSLATVQVGVDGPIEAIDPDSPARFDLLFDEPQSEPVRLLTPDPARPREIATLKVVAPEPG